MRRGSSSGASAESDLQALNAPRHPSPTPSAAPSARRDGFMDVSEVTACKAGHDTKLTRWKLAACIAFPPTLIYHLAKTTRKCNRCGLLVPKRPSGPAATPFLVDM
jgi:hypothetical protein